MDDVIFGSIEHGDFCRECGNLIELINTPSGDRWAHTEYSQDSHEAFPIQKKKTI